MGEPVSKEEVLVNYLLSFPQSKEMDDYFSRIYHAEIGIPIDHTTGKVERRALDLISLLQNPRRHLLWNNLDDAVSTFKDVMDLSDEELIRIAEEDYDSTLEQMREEEQNGYPASFYRYYELGKLVVTTLQGDLIHSDDGSDTFAAFGLSHFTSLKPVSSQPHDHAIKVEYQIDSTQKEIVKIKKSSILCPPHKLGHQRFPDDYHVMIRPRSVGVHLLPTEARKYQSILDQGRGIVKLRPLLATVGGIVNNSVQWTHYRDNDRPNTERLPAEPDMPFVTVQEPLEGCCLDAGEMIRAILFNLGFDDHIRIRYGVVSTPLVGELGHDVTGVYDIKNGYAIFIGSKEGNYKHPVLFDHNQLQKRFPRK